MTVRRRLSSRASAASRGICFLFAAGVAGAQQSAIQPADKQIAAAILPLPASLRQGVTVHGYAPDGKMVTLQKGDGPMVCLASDPKRPVGQSYFHVACYHRELEPFMARGRELRASGITAPAAVDSARYAEIDKGTLKLPRTPMSLYQIFASGIDYGTNAVAAGGRTLFVVYIPFATSATTGISTTPSNKDPWLMFPGTPKAHIMFSGSM